MKKYTTSPLRWREVRNIDTITPQDLEASFHDNTNAMAYPLTWTAFVSSFEMLESEFEILANKSPEWKRLVELYKQKCKASYSLIINADPKLAFELFKLEYHKDSDSKDMGEEWRDLLTTK